MPPVSPPPVCLKLVGDPSGFKLIAKSSTASVRKVRIAKRSQLRPVQLPILQSRKYLQRPLLRRRDHSPTQPPLLHPAPGEQSFAPALPQHSKHPRSSAQSRPPFRPGTQHSPPQTPIPPRYAPHTRVHPALPPARPTHNPYPCHPSASPRVNISSYEACESSVLSIKLMFHSARSLAGIASSPAANIHPWPSCGAGRSGPSACW